jgi:hypothetical protein
VRLGDLLEADVIDQSGRVLGQVHDARLVQDGPVVGTDAAFRLHGLLVGTAAFGTRLGYTGGDPSRRVRGPLPIKALVNWMHRDAVYVPWGAVREVAPGRIVVDAPHDGFAPALS